MSILRRFLLKIPKLAPTHPKACPIALSSLAGFENVPPTAKHSPIRSIIRAIMIKYGASTYISFISLLFLYMEVDSLPIGPMIIPMPHPAASKEKANPLLVLSVISPVNDLSTPTLPFNAPVLIEIVSDQLVVRTDSLFVVN